MYRGVVRRVCEMGCLLAPAPRTDAIHGSQHTVVQVPLNAAVAVLVVRQPIPMPSLQPDLTIRMLPVTPS